MNFQYLAFEMLRRQRHFQQISFSYTCFTRFTHNSQHQQAYTSNLTTYMYRVLKANNSLSFPLDQYMNFIEPKFLLLLNNVILQDQRT